MAVSFENDRDLGFRKANNSKALGSADSMEFDRVVECGLGVILASIGKAGRVRF